MREFFEEPKLDVVSFDVEDVITTSDIPTGGNNAGEFEWEDDE